jgi:hypothetical protein
MQGGGAYCVLKTLNGDNETKPCRKKGLAERQQNRPATSGATNTCCRSDDAARNQRPQRRPHFGDCRLFCSFGGLTPNKQLPKKTPGTRGPGKEPAQISQRLGPMSYVNGRLVFGDQNGDVTELVEALMPGYVPPNAVAVDLSTKASFGFAHRGRASGLLGRPHGGAHGRAAHGRSPAPPTPQAAQLPMSGSHISR